MVFRNKLIRYIPFTGTDVAPRPWPTFLRRSNPRKHFPAIVTKTIISQQTGADIKPAAHRRLLITFISWR